MVCEQALQVVPQLAEELEGELTFSLKAYGDHLAAIGQPSNALWLYSKVCARKMMCHTMNTAVNTSTSMRKRETHTDRIERRYFVCTYYTRYLCTAVVLYDDITSYTRYNSMLCIKHNRQYQMKQIPHGDLPSE